MEATKTLESNATERNEISAETEATSCISQVISSDCIKILETVEFCTVAEAKSKELKTEIKNLTIAKNETLIERDEFMTRNKANATNWESWLQTKYELDKLKCDLKAEYIMADEAAKNKRLKFSKTISTFKSKWESIESAYEKFSEVVDLKKSQEENDNLRGEIEQKRTLLENTVISFSEILTTHENKLKAAMREFAEEMTLLEKFKRYDEEKKVKEMKIKNMQEDLKELEALAEQNKKLGVISFTEKISKINLDRRLPPDTIYSAVDITAFDNISIPVENLEIPTEENIYLFAKTSDKKFDVDSSVQSDAFSDNGSDGEESQVVISQQSGENNESENQYLADKGQYVQNQGNKEDGQLSQCEKQSEGELEQGKANMTNKENATVKNVTRNAEKRASQELKEAPPAKITVSENNPDKNIGDHEKAGDHENVGDYENAGEYGNTGDYGSAGDYQNASDYENTGDYERAGDHQNTGDYENAGDYGNAGDYQNADEYDNGANFEDYNFEDEDRSFNYEETSRAYTNRSFISSEGELADKDTTDPDNSEQTPENRDNPPVSPPSPPVRPPADPTPRNTFSTKKTEESPASTTPFSFSFGGGDGSSIFKLF